MNLQNLQQENGTLLITKIMDKMTKEMKMTQPLNLTKVIKPNVCDYSDAYIVVIGDIKAARGHKNSKVAFKNCAPFRICITHINDEHLETASNLDIIMPMYNLIECSDNYADCSGRLWQFKRDEQNLNDDGNIIDVISNDSPSFKYKSSLTAAAGNNPHALLSNAKIVVPLKYLYNFFR